MIDQSDWHVIFAFRRLADNNAAVAREESFRNRGLSEHTIRALLKTKLDRPEQLLFMSEWDIRRLTGIGRAAYQDICTYRERFGVQ
jgi:hypothetical protein